MRTLAFALIVMLLFAFAAHAEADPKPSPATAFLQAQTDGLAGLRGQFVQTVRDADGQVIEESNGNVSLRAPRQFRWEYTAPFPQLIVADGDRVWVYDPDLEQVSVRQQGNAEQQSPLLVLIDPSELERQFKVEGPQRIDADQQRLLLSPRNADSGLAKAELVFDGVGLTSMQLTDSLGQATEIRFSAWQRNPNFAVDWFAFTPPQGVDVVGDGGSAVEVTPLNDAARPNTP